MNYRPDQAYQVISQEEIDRDQYATIRGSDNRPLFIKSDEKLPSPEFSVVTFNGEKKILPSQNGGVVMEISVPTSKQAEDTATETANPDPTPLPAEGEWNRSFCIVLRPKPARFGLFFVAKLFLCYNNIRSLKFLFALC